MPTKYTQYDLDYQKKPAQVKNRTSRNAARREMKAAGVNCDGKDVHHKDGNPRNNSKKNLTVEPVKKNRGRK